MIGFVILAHYGNKRKRGIEFFNNWIESLQKSCEESYLIIVCDNGSEKKFDCSNLKNYKYVHIKNQMTGGFPHAFNQSIKCALENNCELIHLINDDVTFNESINDYNRIILSHPNKDIGIFGPTTNAGGLRKNNPQYRLEYVKKDKNDIVEVPSVNGFFMSITSEFCKKFSLDNNYCLFSAKPKFASAEHVGFQLRVKKQGAKVFVIKNAWFKHRATGGWKKL